MGFTNIVYSHFCWKYSEKMKLRLLCNFLKIEQNYSEKSKVILMNQNNFTFSCVYSKMKV